MFLFDLLGLIFTLGIVVTVSTIIFTIALLPLLPILYVFKRIWTKL